MGYACISIVGAPDPKNDKINPSGGDGSVLGVITYPLVKIAEKLGVTALAPDLEQLPPGVWISDGTGNGRAYNYIELIDKMTERMSDGRTSDTETEDGPGEHEESAGEASDGDSGHDEEGGVSGDS